jgi:hypothetical protein
MGTRADFYEGRGKDATWLGSIAFDGYPDGKRMHPVVHATSLEAFRAAVAALDDQRDFTNVNQGWPWPWLTSTSTDFAYSFEAQVWLAAFGSGWYTPQDYARVREHDEPPLPQVVFPDMTERQNVTLGARSGLIVITASINGPRR